MSAVETCQSALQQLQGFAASCQLSPLCPRAELGVLERLHGMRQQWKTKVIHMIRAEQRPSYAECEELVLKLKVPEQLGRACMFDLSDLGKTVLQGAALQALKGFLVWAVGTGQRCDYAQATRQPVNNNRAALVGRAMQQLVDVGILQHLVLLTFAVAKQLPAALAKEAFVSSTNSSLMLGRTAGSSSSAGTDGGDSKSSSNTADGACSVGSYWQRDAVLPDLSVVQVLDVARDLLNHSLPPTAHDALWVVAGPWGNSVHAAGAIAAVELALAVLKCSDWLAQPSIHELQQRPLLMTQQDHDNPGCGTACGQSEAELVLGRSCMCGGAVLRTTAATHASTHTQACVQGAGGRLMSSRPFTDVASQDL